MNDYLNHLYPLIPVVHRPSFCQDLASNRDTNDTDFLGLIIALCATVVAALPSKFKEYRLSRTPIRFETREEMINCCHAMLLNLRGPHYFDEINFRKFAASYLMTIAFLQLGEYNRARMMEVEMMQLGRLLHIHKISEYEGLNCIETQLRKKGFWLIFYTQVHEQLQNLRKERLMYFDEALLNSVDLEELLPLEVDDEFIFEDRVLNPSQTTCLTTGFIIHSRVFWTALKSPKSRDVSTPMEQYCQCVRSTHPDAQINYLKARLQDLKYMLDSVPIQLRQWAPPDSNTETKDKEIYSSHFRTMRANLHVTHLWLQSIIIDQIETLEQQQQHCHRSPTDQHHQNPHLYPSLTWWSTREEICRQLLHVLHNIPMANLEPNGLHLTHKIRDVAVGLLTCPFEAHEPASIRAAEYVTEFTEILSRLDTSEKVNTTSLQSWVDTDRVKGSGKGRRDIWNSNWDR
ncbi:putative quinate utilization pathway activator [Phaeomoniella chlamydospora]|uniref:Putative quinate utilization pathway activator n=1 Tax=Phaeomoniella chlamydospora TaxID=158046 RepID=A0A0G2F103_PHACM|nr:putative quinate utilization pathway activator [Phaeomoniella chlamydospora]